MLELTGNYASCKIMIDEVEEQAIKQIYSFLNCPALEGATIRIMPDVHAGAGAVIGFTSTLTDKIIPNFVGVDIGCGVLSANIGKVDKIDFKALDRHIREEIPYGFGIHPLAPKYLGPVEAMCQTVAEETDQDPYRMLRSIGTLGGGNHFIELGKDQEGNVWITVHSGSRNFGLRVCQWHQQRAVKTVGKGSGMDWLEGDEAQLYYKHMDLAQKFALINRRTMVHRILEFFSIQEKNVEYVESIHNYINFEDRVLRKGAISAHAGERVIIPWNMRDGLIIGKGKGNADWNNSAPHGAGRIMGRGQAKRSLSMDTFKSSMEGIWTSCVTRNTIDESPEAYKDYTKVQAAIGDTVDIELTVKPIYNFKAGDE